MPETGGKGISHNTWIHKVARTIISRPLAATQVTPSQVTAVRLITGLAAAAAFALGETLWWTFGAWIFLLSMVLDRADGELARMTDQATEKGHKFDLAADAICNSAIFIGLGIGLRQGDQGLLAVAMGILAGVSVTAVFYQVMRAEELAGQRGGEMKPFLGFDADDAMLLVPVFVLFGFQEGVLFAAAVGAPLFFVGYYFWLKEKLRAEAGESNS